jgi:hypothetical protein
VVAALASLAVSFYQRTSTLQNERRGRAFERHLAQYERIFVAARSTLDAFRDYEAVDLRVSDRSDPFLRQLLAIVTDLALQYCAAVDWRHNSGMAYLGELCDSRL